ncbi:MAG: VOC family protein [Oscillatoriales cyanobacterium]|nr:MAG: VOC family protein [Oscillatoriales cyanobacterium]
MQTTESTVKIALAPGNLRRVHHIALNVRDMKASCHFYGTILGLHELTGAEIPASLTEMVAAGKVANFITPDGTVIDLFWQPDLEPPNPDPQKAFTRANHLAFDIDRDLFDRAVTRATGRGIYFYDPDGFIIEIRCDAVDGEGRHGGTTPTFTLQ